MIVSIQILNLPPVLKVIKKMEDFICQLVRNRLIHFLFSFFGIIFLSSHVILAANGVTLYTPYTKISVPPGESIDYTIDVINSSSELQNVEISMAGVPKDGIIF